MKGIGGFLFFFGLGSIILHFLEREFIILAWVDNWGDTVAWVIRIAMVVVGGVLWLAGQASGGGSAEAD